MITRVSVPRDKPITLSRNVTWLVVILAGALFATFVSPQVSLWGRGLRSSLPLFLLLLGMAMLFRGNATRRQVASHFLPIIAGFAFVGISMLRDLFEPRPEILLTQGITGAISIGLWIAVILVKTVFPESLERVRWISLVMLGVSLGMGIPLLLEQPGIARLTMGNSLADEYAAQLFQKGVANYAWYTPVGFAFPVLATWLYNSSAHRLMKMAGWGLLLAASVATILSTFTMAMVLLIAGALGWLLLAAMTGKSRLARVLPALALIALLVFLPALYLFGSTFESTQFAVQKATRIIEGAVEVGLQDADETGRADMFVDTMETFWKNPLFGAWGLSSEYYFVGGHSSWADTLALQGLFGMFLWLAFLSPSWKRGKRPWSIADGAAGGTLAWILLGVGGILNPTLNSSVGLLLIWLYDDSAV